jgi:hypothetical protein
MTVLVAYLVVRLPISQRWLGRARTPALYAVGVVAAYWVLGAHRASDLECRWVIDRPVALSGGPIDTADAEPCLVMNIGRHRVSAPWHDAAC